MLGERILYGLGRLPAGLSRDDPRLPGIRLGPEPLRLNSEPLPPAAIPDALPDHAARVAAVRGWLNAACGDYARLSRAFIDFYFAAIAAHLAAHQNSVGGWLARFDGLYAADDLLWSALRPLPRAWCPGAAAPIDIAFWDGARLVAVSFSEAAVHGASLETILITPTELRDPETLFGERLAWLVMNYSGDKILPTTPFRRSVAPPG